MSSVIKNKKALRLMIGYVILITIAVAMSIIVYQWMKSYVPKEKLQCPEDVSLFIKNYSCDGNWLNITLKNNGNFGVSGYFVHISNKSGVKLATIDLSQRLKGGGFIVGNSVLFSYSINNSFEPNQESTQEFNTTGITPIYSIEITPVRYQKENNKLRFASCSTSISKENLNC